MFNYLSARLTSKKCNFFCACTKWLKRVTQSGQICAREISEILLHQIETLFKNTSLRTWNWGKTHAYKTLFALQRTEKISVIFNHKSRPAEILSLCTSNHFPPSVHFSKNFPVARLAERSLCTSNRGLGYQIVTAARETVKQYIFAETAFWKYGLG